jgi:hypothetical protein
MREVCLFSRNSMLRRAPTVLGVCGGLRVEVNQLGSVQGYRAHLLQSVVVVVSGCGYSSGSLVLFFVDVFVLWCSTKPHLAHCTYLRDELSGTSSVGALSRKEEAKPLPSSRSSEAVSDRNKELARRGLMLCQCVSVHVQ